MHSFNLIIHYFYSLHVHNVICIILGGWGAALKKDKKVFYAQTFSKYLLIEYNQYSAMVTD